MSAGLAIDRRAIPASRIRRAPGAYDADGRFVEGSTTSSSIRAVIQPASGDQMRDMPEGIRTEANWLLWSRADILVDDEITHAGIRYRVLHVWPRADGGFYRAALGREMK